MIWSGSGSGSTYLVYHVCQKTLNLVGVGAISPAHEVNGCLELRNGNSSSADGRCARLLGFVVSACDENLAEEIPQRNVATTLEGEEDAAFDQLVLIFKHRVVEAFEVASLDASREWEEDSLQVRV